MKLNRKAVVVLLAAAVLGFGVGASQSNRETASSKAAVSQGSPCGQGTASGQAASGGSGASADELKNVLARMNQTAANFKSFQADFDWETCDKLVNETEIQKGRAYFRRHDTDQGKDLEALFNFNPSPQKGNDTPGKQALYKGGIFRLYEPRINRITEREVGKNKSDVDAFMSLGLGGRGDDLASSFNVNWLGWETIDDVKTAKLEVTGKSPSIQKVFSKAVLWIDPERDIAIQQQFFQTSGDYRLTRYHNIKFNEKMSDGTFRLKTKGTPEKVRLGGG